MGFVADGPRIVPVTPDWGQRVSETLAYGTDVMHASATAVSWHVGYQLGPRRSLSFELLAHRVVQRQLMDALLAGHRGRYLLPLWHDVRWLSVAVASGATSVPCATAGTELAAGTKALLYADVNAWEVVEIDTVASDHVGLVDATAAAYGPGARLYPLRLARLRTGSEERMLNGRGSRRRLVADIDDPYDWPALADPTLYRDHPVLEVRPDESEDPTIAYQRLLQGVSYEGTVPAVYDLADQALRLQSTHWALFGRAQQAWFRSLLATLDGRRVPMWLPTFADDLTPAAAIAGGSATMSVQWAGYSLLGAGRDGRQDLRIELLDGTVLYRRSDAAVEAGGAETLTLSAPLDDASIAPEAIRQVSFMALSTLASDSVEIDHITDADGVARATLGWQSVVPDA